MASIAAAGWAVFIAENVILSENRTWIIENYGGGVYHNVYNFLSAGSCASIGYAYAKHRNAPTPTLVRPLPRAGALLQGAGLLLLSQALPKLRNPIQPAALNQPVEDIDEGEPPKPEKEEGKRSNRCPLDFNSYKAEEPYGGVRRITRHPELWALALAGMGRALVRPTPVRLVAFAAGPLSVALCLGAHKDSRYRRHIGGTLGEESERRTSLAPFLAMEPLGPQRWEDVLSEFKQINGGVALGLTLALLLRRRPI